MSAARELTSPYVLIFSSSLPLTLLSWDPDFTYTPRASLPLPFLMGSTFSSYFTLCASPSLSVLRGPMRSKTVILVTNALQVDRGGSQRGGRDG